MQQPEAKIIFLTSRSAVVQIVDGGIFYTSRMYELRLNGVHQQYTGHTITTLRGLLPSTAYQAEVLAGEECVARVEFTTQEEFVTLDVRRFGAKGDGRNNDTAAIQAAISACPPKGRVQIPRGVYKVGPLFLKSNLFLDIEPGAVLSAYTSREYFPVLPGMTESWDEKSEYNLASWEGNPLDCFASILTGIGVENVVISGGGVLEGNAGYHNWWEGEGRAKITAFRPRMIFLNRCKNVTVHGLKVQNSPAWNLHPYFSDNTRWLDLCVLNPKDSPNTDGIDPESVNGLEIAGVYFSLGDDCIAIKAGKYYMGSKYKVPSRNMDIYQCCMRNGHGSVTIGSEMAAGVKDLHVRECRFENTDRGLRVKTRRGRGENAVVENVFFENILMDGVLTPFVVNSFYWCCDPDGRSEYVRCKTPLPVDERTPAIKKLEFTNIHAKNCHVAASFIYGLPEQKIEEVIMRDISIDFDPNPVADFPAMMADVEKCTNKGVFIHNVNKLVIHNVQVNGVKGQVFDLGGIDAMDCDESVKECGQ